MTPLFATRRAGPPLLGRRCALRGDRHGLLLGRGCALLAVLLVIGGNALPVAAAPIATPGTRMEPNPKALESVQIDEHLGDKLPLGLVFANERGQAIKLGDYFDGQTPVILTLNYSDCPMLCSLQLEGMVEALREIDWTMGREYRIVTVSINPNESSTKAAAAQTNYLQLYGKPAAAGGWRFLTGRSEAIERLAGAVGFGYSWVAQRKEYAHAAVAMVCTPDGRLSRYLYGVKYEPKTVRLSLVEASDGRIGTAMDQLILRCFHYDPTAGSYVATAMSLMRAGALFMIGLVGAMIFVLRRIDRRRQAGHDESTHPTSTSEILQPVPQAPALSH